MTDDFRLLNEAFLEDVEAQTRDIVNRQQWTDIRAVKLGAYINGAYVVTVPTSDSQYIGENYFTELDSSGVGRCINTKVEARYGLTVQIGHPPNDKDRWYVMEMDVSLQQNPVTTQPGAPAHSESHTMRGLGYDAATTTGRVGTDPVFIDDRQMWNCAILPWSGLQAKVTAGWLDFGGKRVWLPETELTDQTANVPAGAGKGAYVLVEVDVGQNWTYTKGSEFDYAGKTSAELAAYVPDGSDNTYKWALLLKNGQTSFNYGHFFAGLHFRQALGPTITAISSNANTSGPGIYEIDTTSSAITLTVDSDDIVAAGRVITVKDVADNAATNNITVTTEGSETIDGSATYTIDSDSGSVTLYSDGSNLYTVGGNGGGTGTSSAGGWTVDYSATIPASKDAFIPGTVTVTSAGTLTVDGELYIV